MTLRTAAVGDGSVRGQEDQWRTPSFGRTDG
jgi:hypothetical protein